MNIRKLSGRGLKDHVLRLLKSPDFEQSIKELTRIPGRRAVNPLFSFLYSRDEQIRWRAITAMGSVVSNLAEEDMESARVIMRRLMWNLNDESGGIGWGSPEAMGEIMARHAGLAEEYARVFMSYTREDGNYLENEMLQRDLLRGIGRRRGLRRHQCLKELAERCRACRLRALLAKLIGQQVLVLGAQRLDGHSVLLVDGLLLAAQ